MLRIYFLLYLSKFKIETKHLKEIIQWVSTGEQAEEYALSEDEKRYIRKVVHYTNVLSHFVLFRSKCYDQALTVKKILNEKKIPVALSMGLEITEPGEKDMKAHAWVNFRDWVVIGGKISNNYTPLGSFY